MSNDNEDQMATTRELLTSYGLEPAHVTEVQHAIRRMVQTHAQGMEDVGQWADFRKTPSAWGDLGMVVLCVSCAAVAAGLTLGLVSLDPLEMELKRRAGTPKEKEWAKKVLPLIRKHHLLLVTLLLFNATANETLPLFLDNLVPTLAAIVISVSLVLVFGEIMPSALMTGPKQLQLAAFMSGPTWVLMGIFFPIAYPLSLVLDRLLGHESLRIYTRKELATLMSVQQDLHDDNKLDDIELSIPPTAAVRSLTASDTSPPRVASPQNAPLTKDEAVMVSSILSNTHETAHSVMVDVQRVYALDREQALTHALRRDIVQKGFSRIPVYAGKDKGNIRGYLHVKTLLDVYASEEGSVALASLPLFTPAVVGMNCEILRLLKTFQEGKTHVAIITHDPSGTSRALAEGRSLEGPARAIGIVTMEDVIEKLLRQDIRDEADHLRSGEFGILREASSHNGSACPHYTYTPSTTVVKALRRSNTGLQLTGSTHLSHHVINNVCTDGVECDEVSSLPHGAHSYAHVARPPHSLRLISPTRGLSRARSKSQSHITDVVNV